MIFLDGVGIGTKQARHNPFFAANLPALKRIAGGNMPSIRSRLHKGNRGLVKPIDANLGVDGLPQSGTGQTSLFTGINAARMIGKHFGPYPYSSLRPVIQAENIFKKLIDARCPVKFANAYPKQFFAYINSGKQRLTVTTLSCMLTGIRLLDAGDLMRGSAISADITNERWDQLGYPEIPVIQAEEAGIRFARFAAEHRFVLFEYFLTDHAGHRQDMENAVMVLERLDGFLNGYMRAAPGRTLLVITSDHGNLEDLRTKSHTRNPVPLWAWGEGADRFAEPIRSIRHVAPGIRNWILGSEVEHGSKLSV